MATLKLDRFPVPPVGEDTVYMSWEGEALSESEAETSFYNSEIVLINHVQCEWSSDLMVLYDE